MYFYFMCIDFFLKHTKQSYVYRKCLIVFLYLKFESSFLSIVLLVLFLCSISLLQTHFPYVFDTELKHKNTYILIIWDLMYPSKGMFNSWYHALGVKPDWLNLNPRRLDCPRLHRWSNIGCFYPLFTKTAYLGKALNSVFQTLCSLGLSKLS